VILRYLNRFPLQVEEEFVDELLVVAVLVKVLFIEENLLEIVCLLG
jgi:hypothetical protein